LTRAIVAIFAHIDAVIRGSLAVGCRRRLDVVDGAAVVVVGEAAQYAYPLLSTESLSRGNTELADRRRIKDGREPAGAVGGDVRSFSSRLCDEIDRTADGIAILIRG